MNQKFLEILKPLPKKIFSFFYLFFLFNFQSTIAYAELNQKLDFQLEQSILDENWEKVGGLLDSITYKNPSPILRMIKGHANLALNKNNESLIQFYKMSENDLIKWEKWSEEFVSQNKDKSVAYYFIGDSYSRIGDLKKAYKYFSKSIVLNNNNYLSWNARGVILALQKDFIKSLEDFTAALKFNPEFLDAKNNIGMMRINQGQGRKGAKRDFQAVIRSNDNFALAYHGLGCLELLKSDTLPLHENKNIQKAFSLLPVIQDLLKTNGVQFKVPHSKKQIHLSSTEKIHVEDVFLNKTAVAVAQAAENGDFIKLRAFSNEGANLDAQGFDGATPLIWAAVKGNQDGFRTLLELGADPNIEDDKGVTVLMLAAEMGNLHLMQLAVKYGGNVHATHPNGATALMVASSGGNTDLVQYLISQDADVNASDDLGNTALIYSSMAGQSKVVELLLKSGADKLRINSLGLSAIDLINVAEQTKKNDNSLKQLLIVKASDIFGHGALSIALEDYSASKISDSFSFALDGVANINQAGWSGITPLHWMLLIDDFEGFILLLRKGANPNLTTKDGITTVFTASRVKDYRFLEAALTAGGNPNIQRDSDGATPLIEASITGRVEQIRLLIEAGVDPNAQDVVGLSPLHHAVTNDRLDVTSLLIEAGADPKIGDLYGNSAMDYANIIGNKRHSALMSRTMRTQQ